MRILVDLDDVIADFVGAWQVWHEVHCDCMDLNGSPSVEIESMVECENINDFFKLPLGGYAGVNPIWSAVSGIKTLAKEHDVVIVTKLAMQGIAESAEGKFYWVAKHLGDEFVPRLIITPVSKRHVVGDVLIDDQVSNFEEWDGKHILLTRPWNVDAVSTDERTFVRAGNWQGILSIIGGINGMLAV